MKIHTVLCVLFGSAACFFAAGTVRHIVATHAPWLPSLLLAGGYLCLALVFYRRK